MTTATPSAAFGASIKRREDPRLITGRGTYVDDIKMVGMLHIVLWCAAHTPTPTSRALTPQQRVPLTASSQFILAKT